MDELEVQVLRAQEGDPQARSRLLEEHRLFIQKVAGRLCGRKLRWGEDDELSEALIAFNEAIDTFRSACGVPFLAYARRVIRNRLVDFYRKEARAHAALAPSGEGGQLAGECGEAHAAFTREVAAREREEEIRQYAAELEGYGISFERLVRVSPKHRDSRAQLAALARELAEDEALFSYLEETKKLPLQAMSGGKLSRKTLERHRAYIIALALIFRKPEEYPYLASYLRGLAGSRGGGKSAGS